MAIFSILLLMTVKDLHCLLSHATRTEPVIQLAVVHIISGKLDCSSSKRETERPLPHFSSRLYRRDSEAVP